MTKVKIENYQMRVSNALDEQRKYSISCTLNVLMDKVISIMNGSVLEDINLVADFNMWSENNLQLTFRNVSKEIQCSVTEAVNEFITEAINSVENITE